MSGTFNVRDPAIETRLRELGGRIGAALEGSGVGFALFLVQYGDDGGTFYISSAERESIVPAIEEWCKRQTQ